MAVNLNIKYLNLFCGYLLTKKEQDRLIEITMLEFLKDKKDRRYPYQLVSEAIFSSKYQKWITK